MLCPSAVVVGGFINTSMTCSQTGGGNKGGDVGRGPGRGVEASSGGSRPEGVSGDTRPCSGHDGR